MNTMLPALPKTLGRLSDIFISSLGAITGTDNRLALKKAKSVCTILVDGLGAHNLSAAGGHAKFLNRALSATSKASCGFPSTTAASIASFATGLQAGEHGLVGYQVMNPATNQLANLLNGWGSNLDPFEWQPSETVSERSIRAGVQSFVVGPAEYRESGFTQATMRGATYLEAKTFQDRFDRAIEAIHLPAGSLVYLYIPELDQIAHSKGVGSAEWLAKLEDLDSVAEKASKAVPANSSLYLTADHGVIDVQKNRHIFLDDFVHLLPGLQTVGGDPRVNYLYFEESNVQHLAVVAKDLQEALGKSAVVASVDDLVRAGWFGPVVTVAARSRMPELFVIAIAEVALYHRGFAKNKSLEMVGQHGSISSAELAIPFLDLKRLM